MYSEFLQLNTVFYTAAVLNFLFMLLAYRVAPGKSSALMLLWSLAAGFRIGGSIPLSNVCAASALVVTACFLLLLLRNTRRGI